MGDDVAKKVLVAVDDGYAQTKALAVFPRMAVEHAVRFSAPTAVKSGHVGLTGMDGEGFGWYVSDGKPFTFNLEGEGERTRYDGFHLSDLNRIAVYHAVCHTVGGLVRPEAGQAGLAAAVGGLGPETQIEVGVGVPFGDYFINGKKNADFIRRKEMNLMIPVAPQGTPRAPRIAKVRTMPQALVAYYDYRYDDRMEIIPDRAGSVAIVDIGGRTTDCVVINDWRIEHSRSGTEMVGVLDVCDKLKEVIRFRHGVQRDLSPAAYMSVLRTGRLKLYGKDHDVSDLVTQAISEVAGQVLRAAQRLIAGDGYDLSAILLVGGGAAVFEELRGLFPHGSVVKEPEFANARGILKFLLMADLHAHAQAA